MFSQSSNPVKKDMELDQPPEDSVSKVAFAPNSNYLVASSWDNNVSRISDSASIVAYCTYRIYSLFNAHLHFLLSCQKVQIRCYEIQPTTSSCKAQQSHAGPILDCCWHQV